MHVTNISVPRMAVVAEKDTTILGDVAHLIWGITSVIGALADNVNLVMSKKAG